VDKFDRIYKLHQALDRARHPVPGRQLEELLECSRSTVQRAIQELRDYLGAPVFYDQFRGGYRYLRTDDAPVELPGLWFNASEVHALLAMQQLLADVQPGLLDPFLAPLRRRVERILSLDRGSLPGAGQRGRRQLRRGEVSPQISLFPEGEKVEEPQPAPASSSPPSPLASTAELVRRVRLVTLAARRATPERFAAVAGALGARKRLAIRYHGRERDRVTEREVSPQRLVHYRDNWYLEAHCHQVEALRNFSVDRILEARSLDAAALELDAAALDAHFAATYGIFSGAARDTAVLCFSAESARWVADERWHPDQRGETLPDGRYRLEVPYSDPRELVMDILRHGPEVEVLAPEALRATVRERLAQALGRYG
jgi:proteasome accessory factor C